MEGLQSGKRVQKRPQWIYQESPGTHHELGLLTFNCYISFVYLF